MNAEIKKLINAIRDQSNVELLSYEFRDLGYGGTREEGKIRLKNERITLSCDITGEWFKKYRAFINQDQHQFVDMEPFPEICARKIATVIITSARLLQAKHLEEIDREWATTIVNMLRVGGAQ